MEGTTFGDVPLNLEMKLEVWDSPNSAGVVIDAVRCCKLALDHGLKGSLIAPSAYFKKSPPQQFPDDVAHAMVEDFIRTYGHGKEAPPAAGPVQVKVKMAPATGAAGGGRRAPARAAKPAAKRAKPAAKPAAKPRRKRR